MILISAKPKRFAAHVCNGSRLLFNYNNNHHNNRFQVINSTISSTALKLILNNNKSNTESILLTKKCFSSSLLSDKINNIIINEPNQISIDNQSINWFTGKKPSECPGFIDNQLFSLPQLCLEENSCTSEKLQEYFDNTWTLTEVLLSSLISEESFLIPPYHDLRHPLIFYYGHPAALYINKLRVAGLIDEPINPYYEAIFETGVDEMSWDDLSKNKMMWPSVADVYSYRQKVYDKVSQVISNLTHKQCANISVNSPLWSLVMAFEHERIHLETSSVLISEMPLKHIRIPKYFPKYHPSANKSSSEKPIENVDYPKNEMISISKQNLSLGKSYSVKSFGWDNEYGSRSYHVPSFSASKYKITNGEFFEFVLDSGYHDQKLWSTAGWGWKTFRNIKWPSLWVNSGPQGLYQFELRNIFSNIPMKWNWPVCVNLHEAEAFINWKKIKTGKNFRILTELEHSAIRDGNQKQNDMPKPEQLVDPVLSSKDGRLGSDFGINSNLSYSSMSPVDAFPPNSNGFHDVFGNAWEWTSDYFSAFLNFKVHKYYEDFSTPCFDGLHHVIQGCSFISTGNLSSIFSRYHFRPHFFQHSSFRIVEIENNQEMITSDTDAPGPFVGSYPFRRSVIGKSEAEKNQIEINNFNENNILLSKNYNVISNSFQIPSDLLNGYKNLSDMILHQASLIKLDVSKSKIIDVGCGVGGLTSYLAKFSKLIIGIDHNSANIETAKDIFNKKSIHYSFIGEGNMIESKNIILSDYKSKIDFRCADPMCLPAEMSNFDIVILNDVIDKVSTPNSILGRVSGVRSLVKKQGLLVVVSAYKWDESTTPKNLWLNNNENDLNSESELILRLSNDYKLISSNKLPIYWQESQVDIKGKLYTVTILQRI